MATTQIKRAADYVGMTPAELQAALKSADTCPLCVETGPEDHGYRACLNVLNIMADRSGY